MRLDLKAALSRHLRRRPRALRVPGRHARPAARRRDDRAAARVQPRGDRQPKRRGGGRAAAPARPGAAAADRVRGSALGRRGHPGADRVAVRADRERAAVGITMLYRTDREAGSWRMGERARQLYPHRFREVELRRAGRRASQQLVAELAGGAGARRVAEPAGAARRRQPAVPGGGAARPDRARLAAADRERRWEAANGAPRGAGAGAGRAAGPARPARPRLAARWWRWRP